MILFGIAGKVLGFLREAVLANYYGAGADMDAYNIAFSAPGVLLIGLGAAFATTFIPAFTRKAESDGRASAFALSNTLFTAFGLLGLILCGFGAVFASAFVKILAPMFDPVKAALAVSLTRILMVTGALNVLNGCLIGLLQAQEIFAIPALLSFPVNLTVIATVILLAGRYGVMALAVGTALSAAAQFIFLLPPVLRTGFRIRPSLTINDPDVTRVARLVLPVFVGTMLLQVNTIIDRAFASGLPVGSISAVGYAGKLTSLIISILATSVGTVSLPALSQAAVCTNREKLRQTMLRAVMAVNVLVVPATVGLIVLRKPIVRLLFERGAFDAVATEKTTTALLYLSLGLFAYGLRDIFGRTFYALQDTMTPMINATMVIAANIVLLTLLVPRYGLAGLTGATSLAGVIAAAVLLLTLRRKMGNVGAINILASLLRITALASVMGLVMHFLYPRVLCYISDDGIIPQILVLAITVALGMVVYATGLVLVKAPEVQIALDAISRRRTTFPPDGPSMPLEGGG